MGIENRQSNDILKLIGESPRQIAEGLRRFRRDAEFFSDNSATIVKEHPNEFVAVLDKKVVGSSPNIMNLVSSLTKSGILPRKAFIRFTGKQRLILANAA